MKHTVEQGEHLTRIAFENKFRDPNTVWNDGGNADLRNLRDNPNVLFPGDELFLPDWLERQEDAATGQVHTFVAPAPELHLKLILQDVNGDPITNCDCVLEIDGVDRTLTTNGDGKLDEDIPIETKTGELRIRGSVYRLAVGNLDPIDKKTGQRARLANLGYYFGDGSDNDDDDFRTAVEEFQCDNGLSVDGDCGPNTQKKLKALHRC